MPRDCHSVIFQGYAPPIQKSQPCLPHTGQSLLVPLLLGAAFVLVGLFIVFRARHMRSSTHRGS